MIHQSTLTIFLEALNASLHMCAEDLREGRTERVADLVAQMQDLVSLAREACANESAATL